MAKCARKKATVPKPRAFRGLRKEPDRWPDAPPLSSELAAVDLIYFMKSGLRSGALTAFEQGVAQQVLRRAETGRPLNDWNRRALDEMGVLRKCWDNDPDLWDRVEETRRPSGLASAPECRGE